MRIPRHHQDDGCQQVERFGDSNRFSPSFATITYGKEDNPNNAGKCGYQQHPLCWGRGSMLYVNPNASPKPLNLVVVANAVKQRFEATKRDVGPKNNGKTLARFRLTPENSKKGRGYITSQIHGEFKGVVPPPNAPFQGNCAVLRRYQSLFLNNPLIRPQAKLGWHWV